MASTSRGWHKAGQELLRSKIMDNQPHNKIGDRVGNRIESIGPASESSCIANAARQPYPSHKWDGGAQRKAGQGRAGEGWI
ncbi:hypothetical protein AK812_SmicGene48008 [Symbiodinium microadriaticum]|uniref:Uncharacterized protein n=1 Tax=Symbiodinium microadriaticum TaxID=2951 RepID=A0A1Q9BQJ9_SYMMI|nr:hypothetical protein AK812_SmicGene48008 [Symbiodinium microadriaticum]